MESAPLDRLVAVMERLLAPDGCPWDRAQTLESLRPYVVEEAFEVVDAIDRGSPEALREELGDQLFLVTFLSAIAARAGHFAVNDVIDGVVEKMTRRHPWVFGDERAREAPSEMARWEAQKAKEKRDRGALAGVPAAMPALLRALRVGEKAAAHGYDFADARAARAKLDEELDELDEALASGDGARTTHELGDVLFTVANLGRKLGVDPEAALRSALDRFSGRFHAAEKEATASGTSLASLSDAERDALWTRAKARAG